MEDTQDNKQFAMGEFSIPLSIQKEAEENLKNPKLLELIKKQLDNTHKKDDLEKMFAFLITRTAYLKNPRDRKSIALVGDTSVGKDNLIDAIFLNTPFTDVEKLTNATQATVEEDLLPKKIIAFSEMNKFRQNGANQDLTEQLKQLAEGGINSMKKDAATGFKTTKKIRGEQKTMIYGTTEEKKDDELATRYATITIRADEEKVIAVNNNTLEASADPKKIAEGYFQNEINWLAVAHLMLEPYEVVLPYNEALTLDKEGSGKYFDTSNPRSQRDLKRLVCLAKAIAWMHQKQRPVLEFYGQKMIVASPADFINALEIGGSFFDISYLGIDGRAKKTHDYLIENHKNESIPKKQLREELGISRNTLTKRLEALEEVGLVILEPLGIGKDTLVRPAQNLPNTWSKPAQKFEIMKKLDSFDINAWLSRYEKNEQVLRRFGQVVAQVENLLYDVKVATCSKSFKDMLSDLKKAVNQPEKDGQPVGKPIFEQVGFAQVRFKRKQQAWKGADGKTYGDYTAGQVVELPTAEADFLIQNKLAEPVGGATNG